MVKAAERELIRRAGVDAPRWVATWKSRQRADGTWGAYPILSRRKNPLTIADTERRTARRRA